MKRIFSVFAIISIFAISVLMTGCGPIYETTYSYVPPKSYRGRTCVNQCLSQKGSCRNNCRLLNQSCRLQANAAAEPAYQAYLRSMRRQGKPPVETIADFADYSGCQSNCGCDVNYRQCYTNCGGKIIPHTVCTAFCNKAKPAS